MKKRRMKKRNETLEKERKELTPVFASYESTIEFSPKHAQIKPVVLELNSLWKNYSEIYRELERNTTGNEVLHVSIQDLSKRISEKIKEIGKAIYSLIDELEGINFQIKYKEFEKAQEGLCQTACSILYIDKNSLSPDLLEELKKVEYSLYKCLTLGQNIAKKKEKLENSWIRTKEYETLKYLYRNCNYNLKEGLKVHKIVTQNIKEQKKIHFEILVAQELNSEFIDSVNNQFMTEQLIVTHSVIYNDLTLENKIQHHELSIYQRRVIIDKILKHHKRIINEIDVINWCVGKEAKNIVNMERTIEGKYDLSMKKLFSLFESSSNKLKEYEITLSQYGKLVTSSKRAESTVNRLFQIKSLDFNYLIIEGNLRRLKEDLELLHSASREIYNRRNEVIKENNE